MDVIVDSKNRIRDNGDHYALLKLERDKKRNKTVWLEYRWFSSLEGCISFLTRKRLTGQKTALPLADYLKEYARIKDEIEQLVRI